MSNIINIDDYREKTLSDEQVNNLIFGPIVEAHLGEFDPDKVAEKVIDKELENADLSPRSLY